VKILLVCVCVCEHHLAQIIECLACKIMLNFEWVYFGEEECTMRWAGMKLTSPELMAFCFAHFVCFE